jgi:RHS repeat-associated protein
VTGLDYAVNRQYDSQQGRFTQVDPIGMGAANISDPQTLNMYTYCGNDPVNFTDPSGLFFKKLFSFLAKLFKWIAVVVSVAVVVLSIASGFGVPAAGAILKGLNSILGAIGGFINKITGGLLAKVTGVVNGTVGKVLNRALSKVLGLPFAETTMITKGAMGLTALQIAGNVGAIASHFTQSKDVKKQERFDSAIAAAIAALQSINAQSIEENQEYAGSICENLDGSFVYTPPTTIKKKDVSEPEPCDSGQKQAGYYHTHAAANKPGQFERFSRGDVIAANEANVPEFLGTPSGRIKMYDPVNARVSPKNFRKAGVFLPDRTPVPSNPRKP